MKAALESYVEFEATFRPRRTDDLKEGSPEWVGWHGTWRVLWEIEDGDYAGEWACEPVSEKPRTFIWAPSGDLVTG